MPICFDTSSLRIALDERGFLSSCAVLGSELIARPAPLARLLVLGELHTPTAARREGDALTLSYGALGEVRMVVSAQKRYLVFRVDSCPTEAEALLIGPLEMRLQHYVGEILGVLHDEERIVGAMGLHVQMLGGFPEECLAALNDEYAYSGEPVNISVEHMEVHARAAARTGNGAALQLHVRNRSVARSCCFQNIPMLAPALPYDDARIEGAAFALWGGAKADALQIVETIELEQGLPHPMIGGHWGKTSRETMRAYLISDFEEADVPFVLEKAKAAGLSHIYHTDPFDTWGHFTIDPHAFPDREESLKRVCALAAQAGIGVGTHTLTNFTTPNDAYVTPTPHPHLLRQGEGLLIAAISADQQELEVRDHPAFHAVSTLNCVQIEQELITFTSAELQGETARLLGCTRGAFGTSATPHAAETPARKLWDYPYKTLFPDIFLQDEFCDRLIELYNQTGLTQISFDGLEGCRYTGHDEYATTRFVARCYAGWNAEVVNDASRLNHYNWHIHSRMNWGEPWGEEMREGQVAYRISNQDFFRRNLFPGMLGWFLIRLASKKFRATTMEDLEWALAEAAGFDAGYGMTIRMPTLHKHGHIDLFMETMRRWDALRLSGLLTPAQKEQLRDPATEWHLEQQDGAYRLYPVQLSRAFTCDLSELQPGQSGGADWVWSNDFPQERAFELQLYVDGDGEIRNPAFQSPCGVVKFQATLSDAQYLLYDGQSARICDKNFNPLGNASAIGSGALKPGTQAVSFSCDHDKYDTPEVRVRYKLLGEPWEIRA